MYAITDPSILALLQKKAEEGVEVTVFYDPSASIDLLSLTNKYFHPHAVSIKGLMHRKILVIDEERIFLGSANLTTTSLKMHDNIVAGLFHPPLAQFLKNPTSSSLDFELKDQQGQIWLLPEGQDHAISRLISLIDEAEDEILIAMFTLTHPELTYALIAAEKRGVHVKIALDYYTARGASRVSVEAFEENKIPLFLSMGHQLLHHKWAFIDQKTLILGSANWTQAAFTQNSDCFLILDEVSQEQKKFLKRIWKILELEAQAF